MADKKISALPAATTPLAGTEVLPIVQSGTTDKVSVANLTAGRSVAVGSLASSGTVSATGSAEGANFSGLQVDNASAGSGSPANTVSLNFANFSVVKGRITAAVYGDGWMDFATDNDIAKMRITAGGDIKNNLGNLVVGTAGKGIDFSANANAPGMTSEVLTWYEEGAFTPVVEGSTSAGTATYTAQLGSYTRVGRLVHFQIYLSWSAGTGTGGLYVSGLPFVSGSSNLAYGSAYAPVFFDVALAANNYCSGAYIPAGGTTMRFYQNPIGGGAATVVDYDAAGEVMIVGQYFV